MATPQKSLQIQYLRDFESMGLVELKGKANYHCGFKFEDGTEMSCEDADFFFPEEHGGKGSSGEEGEGSRVSQCTGYKLAKKHFVNTPLGVTNFAYYLTETTYAGQLKNRTMLVLDEAHGCEQQILGLASIEITRYRCEEVGIEYESVPYIKADAAGQGVALDWLISIFKPAAVAKEQELTLDAEALVDQKGRQKEAGKLIKRARALARFIAQLDMFLKGEPSERKKWMVWSESDVSRCPHCGAKQKFSGKTCWKCKGKMPLTPAKMIVKPLTATLFADRFLFSKAQMVVLMSATILDFNTFLNNLGIDRKDAVCIALPSDFPVETRRILYHPVANMSHQNIEQSLPLMASEVADIMRKHANEKGIIHCLDEQTRVLTLDGFKNKYDLKKGDLVATRNPMSGELEYQPALQVVHRHHKGKMVGIDKQGLSMLVTTDHLAYAIIGKNGKNSVLFPAELMVSGGRFFGKKKAKIFKIPKTASWGGKSGTVSRAYAAFLGWFCSEGCSYVTEWEGNLQYKTDIAQTGIKNTEIPAVIEAIGHHAYIHNDKTCDTATITNKALCLELRKTCYEGEPSCYTKKVPDLIKNSDPETIKEFLRTLVAGDGSERSDKPVTRAEAPFRQFYTSSERLRDDVVELALKCGWCSSFSKQADVGRLSKIGERVITQSVPTWVVYIGSGTETHRVLPGDAHLTDYDGEVFCPVTENGIIFVERNGTTYWTGNCHTYRITRYIVDYLKRNGLGHRVLTHEEGVAGDRERIIQEHIDKVGEPTVIISPSMTEGLDLKDDLSRFSIVVKVPYPFLSDYVKARNAMDGGRYYAWTTALAIQQETGRSNRHQNDFATHYILDEAFGYFIQKNGGMFSPWWAESVFFPGEYEVDWKKAV